MSAISVNGSAPFLTCNFPESLAYPWKGGRPLKLTAIFFLLIFHGSALWARSISVLFLGNSYTYLPGLGTPEDPALPKMIRQLAESIDPDLKVNYEFNTPGGYKFEDHYNDAKSLALLVRHFDKIILQGNSIESLDLTPWWFKNGNRGRESFSIYLPKVIDLALQSSTDVTLYVNWGWSTRHALLAPDHEGLYFPAGRPKAGQKWCGVDKFEYQKKIDQSYEFQAKLFPVYLSKVGRAWIRLQRAGLVTEEELYVPGDWSHPSQLGSFIAALRLVKDSLKLDIAKNLYVPPGLDKSKARAIQSFLAIR